MSALEWDGSLETGFDDVDRQHRTLIGIFNEFEQGLRSDHDPSAVEEVIVRMCDYVSTHFADEEALMLRFGYADNLVSDHVSEHKNLSARTRELALAHRAGADSALELSALLRAWLVDHILRVDRRLVAYIQLVIAAEGQPPGGLAAESDCPQ